MTTSRHPQPDIATVVMNRMVWNYFQYQCSVKTGVIFFSYMPSSHIAQPKSTRCTCLHLRPTLNRSKRLCISKNGTGKSPWKQWMTLRASYKSHFAPQYLNKSTLILAIPIIKTNTTLRLRLNWTVGFSNARSYSRMHIFLLHSQRSWEWDVWKRFRLRN